MSEEEEIYFGKFEIDKRQIFYNKNNILGIVNISPIVKDHVLVIPKSNKKNEYGDLNNKIDQFHKLEPLVAQNLYLAVHEIENAFIHNIEGINGFNIAMQDGRSAGQSVPHVHVHILPRKGNEFSPPDRVHIAIERGDMTPEGNNEEFQVEQMRIPPRRGEEGMAQMVAEAEIYKQWFTTSQSGGMDNLGPESSKQTGGSSGSYKFLIDEYQKDMEYFRNKKGGKKTKRRKIKNKVTKKKN